MLGFKLTIQLKEGLQHTIDYFTDTVWDGVLDLKPERSHKYFSNIYFSKVKQKET
jgi:hypothetical protein